MTVAMPVATWSRGWRTVAIKAVGEKGWRWGGVEEGRCSIGVNGGIIEMGKRG